MDSGLLPEHGHLVGISGPLVKRSELVDLWAALLSVAVADGVEITSSTGDVAVPANFRRHFSMMMGTRSFMRDMMGSR